MDGLESIIQSEVSQKEINKEKNGTDESICRAGVETQVQRMDMRRWRVRIKKRLG